MGNSISIGSTVRGIKPIKLGDDSFPVIFANIGVTSEVNSIVEEKRKIQRAISAGVDAISDLSLVDNVRYVQSKLIENIQIPFSTVTVYEAFIKAKKNNMKIDAEELIHIFEEEISRGMDIITLHATVFKDDVNLLKKTQRAIPCTSRGGTMMLELLKANEYENPFYVYFDDILKIASKYSVSISLGPCYRPGSVFDSGENDELYFVEMNRMSELVKRAQNQNIGITIEGIGHAPINRIPQIIRRSKEICHNAPYRVLTVAADIALGYDHIASAIASSVAVMHGANSITCVTRSEHLGLPTADDLEEAIISARIAAYCGYSAKMNDFQRDYRMSLARAKNGCIGQLEEALYPQGALEILKRQNYNKLNKACAMCGEYCPFEANDRIKGVK